MPKKAEPSSLPPRPLLQWAMATAGLLITLSAIGIIVWEMAQPDAEPRLSTHIVARSQSDTGYVVEVKVANGGDDTAANVDIEGRVADQTATATLDYVPGHGHAVAYLRFDIDPSSAVVTVKGWSAP